MTEQQDTPNFDKMSKELIAGTRGTENKFIKCAVLLARDNIESFKRVREQLAQAQAQVSQLEQNLASLDGKIASGQESISKFLSMDDDVVIPERS